MKKLIPLLFLSTTAFYSTIGSLPVTAMGCSSSADKFEIVCDESDIDCKKKQLENRIN